MCHKLSKPLLLLFCIIYGLNHAVAQISTQSSQDFENHANRENSPYSRFGIGEFRNSINPVLKGMGSATSAYSNPFTVNTDNPASYASIRLTTYEGSLYAGSRTVTSGAEKFRTGMATINNMNIGIPVGKHMGMCIGFKPVTHIYYRLSDTAVIPVYGNSVRTFLGDGSLNYAFLGLAGKVKGFSLGVNFGYLFGTTVYASLLESIDNTQNVNDALFSKVVKSGGVYWKAGAQYETKLNKKLFLKTGATLSINQDISTRLDEFWLSYNYAGSDTSYSIPRQWGKLTMPMMYSVGVQLSDSNQWLAAIDFSAADWSGYKGLGRADSTGAMSYKIAAGGEFTPDAAAGRNYLNRVSYRLGFYYGLDYLSLRNTPINYYALTFGFGLPFKRYTDKVNTSFEIGRRGSETNGLFKENFVRAGFGITLNDRWFIKRSEL